MNKIKDNLGIIAFILALIFVLEGSDLTHFHILRVVPDTWFLLGLVLLGLFSLFKNKGINRMLGGLVFFAGLVCAIIFFSLPFPKGW